MNDQVMEETIVTLHPESQHAREGMTKILRFLMNYYAADHPSDYWATLVSSPPWREKRPEIIRTFAEQEWIDEYDEPTALKLGEIQVMAIEACAGHWTPEQCRLSAVRIDGTLRMSLVCSVEEKASQ